MKRNKIIMYSLAILVLLSFLYLNFKTGLFNPEQIDKQDLENWEYQDGIIKGAEEIILEGEKKTCWYMIHGYSSSPKDFNELASKVNEEFNEYVKVPRLKGHGETPSKIQTATYTDWFEQVHWELHELLEECDRVNLVGFSMGGFLALELAEEKHKINNLYLISPFLNLKQESWKLAINALADTLIYLDRPVIPINSPTGKKEHISYYSTPLQPVKTLLPMIEIVKQNLKDVEVPTLIQHSINDVVIDFSSSQLVYDKISSENKKLISYKESNHVLTRDYDKEQVINEIITFEKKLRN